MVPDHRYLVIATAAMLALLLLVMLADVDQRAARIAERVGRVWLCDWRLPRRLEGLFDRAAWLYWWWLPILILLWLLWHQLGN